MSDQKHVYVTTAELKSELRAMRWEVRFLVALGVTAGNVAGYFLHTPAVNAAVGVLHTVI